MSDFFQRVVSFVAPISRSMRYDPNLLQKHVMGPIENFLKSNYPNYEYQVFVGRSCSYVIVKNKNGRGAKTPFLRVNICDEDTGNEIGSLIMMAAMNGDRFTFFNFNRVVLLQSPANSKYSIGSLRSMYAADDVRVVKNLWKEDIVGHILDFLTEFMESAPVHGLK